MKDMSNLLALLQDAAGGETSLVAEEHGPTAVQTASPTVLALDKWGQRRGNEITDEWKEQGAEFDNPQIAADAHGALFEPEPQLAANPADAQRAAWWTQLMETPEYRALHNQTMLDSVMAGIAAKGLCDQWAEYADDNPAPEDGQPAPGSDGESIADSLARMRSTRKAVEQAAEDVGTAKDVAAGLGMGAAGQPLNPAALAAAFKRVRNSDLLRKIMAWAGRGRNRCRSLQKNKVHAIRGEITGIELGGGVGRLLPYDLAQVAGVVPELHTLALYRLAQRRMNCYRHKKNEPKRAGPIIVTVDESGSMSGEKIVAAKGIAVTMAWLARQQKRWIALVGFSGGTEGTRLALPPNRFDDEALMAWLEHFYGGGTTLDVPLKEMSETYWPEFVAQGLQRGKTDHIIITDAIVSCPTKVRDDYLAWSKTEKEVKTYGIVIGNDSAGDLADVCERHWCLPRLDLGTDAVEEVLSI